MKLERPMDKIVDVHRYHLDKTKWAESRVHTQRYSAFRTAFIASLCILVLLSCNLGFNPSVCRPPFTVPPSDPATEYLRFFAVGDAGSGEAGQIAIAESMTQYQAEFGASFALMLGDNFYPDGVTSTADPQWQTKFEQMYDSVSLDFPFYAVLGNHDYHQNAIAQVEYTAEHPESRWKMPARYYSFTETLPDSTQVQFFALDTFTILKEDAQFAWFEESLQASTADWKIVFSHYPMYSNGKHGYSPALIALLTSSLAEAGVDLYVAGHDHDLQILEPVNGTMHLVSGAGCRPRATQCKANTIYAYDQLGFMAFRVSKIELVVNVILKDAELDFCYVIEK